MFFLISSMFQKLLFLHYFFFFHTYSYTFLNYFFVIFSFSIFRGAHRLAVSLRPVCSHTHADTLAHSFTFIPLQREGGRRKRRKVASVGRGWPAPRRKLTFAPQRWKSVSEKTASRSNISPSSHLIFSSVIVGVPPPPTPPSFFPPLSENLPIPAPPTPHKNLPRLTVLTGPDAPPTVFLNHRAPQSGAGRSA